jgi:uncharacterized protein YkwD
MMRRELLPGLVFALVLVTSAAYSQTAEKQTAQPPDSTQKKAEPQPQHDTQVIEPPPYRSPDEKKPDLKAVIKSIIEQTNAFRESEKRPRVVENAKLMETARYFADYMARTDRYGHRADESDPGERATKHGYEYGLISENIAYAFGSDGFTTEAISKQLVEGWEKSPGHRKNMLDPDVTEIGVAIAQSEKTGYYYAVQMFGRPKADAVRFEISIQGRRPGVHTGVSVHAGP